MPTGTKGDYEVGYGKPPRGAGFKKGQSGNPRRRPPGAKNLATLLNDALNEPVTIDYGDCVSTRRGPSPQAPPRPG
jgi:hypothetical protein